MNNSDACPEAVMSNEKPKIYIIDNEVEICKLFKDFFDFIGYDSFYETDGEKALKGLREVEYDVLFVDLKLETLSGIEILKKSKIVNPLAEVIVVTGFGSEETVLMTLAYGATSYLQKPISFSEIRVQTEEALAKRRFNILTKSLQSSIPADDHLLQRHFDNILNLDKLSEFLNRTIDIDLLADTILHGTAEMLSAYYFVFFFYDKVNREMVIFSRETITETIMNSLKEKVSKVFEQMTSTAVDESYNVRVSRKGVVKNSEHVACDFNEMESSFVPLLIEDTISGTLGLFGKKETLPHDVQDLLYLIANRTSHVLANATIHRDTKMLALTDGLTGLLNHRAFHDRLDQEYERFRRYGSHLSLIVADLDDLKKFNDTYGHPVGDEVLRLIGAMLREASRETDVLARYGGDEFVILLPQTNATNAYNMGERIRKNIHNYPFMLEGKEIHGSVTMGVATLPHKDIASSQDFLEFADKALYEAKRQGKNRIVVAEAD